MADPGYQRPLGNAPLATGADPVLFFCRILNAITGLVLVLCGAAFAMAIVLRGDAPKKDAYFVSGQLVRCAGTALSLLALLVETEWRWVFKAAPLMELWLPRGLAYIFLAALTFREAYPSEKMTDFQKSLQLYRTVASAALATCAALYLMGGLLCMGALRRARQRKEDRLVEAETEFEELERRRRELQRLLGRPAEP